MPLESKQFRVAQGTLQDGGRRLAGVSSRPATVPRAAWSRPPSRRVRALRDRLRLLYGRPLAPPHGQGIEELILTVLSQSTNDRNRDVAYVRLRARFPSWEEVRDVPTEEVEAAIQPGGLHRQKAIRIQQILRALPDPPDLAFLPELGVEAARAYLTALPGVGRKTAACVLLFAFGLPDVPVDTHVSRVGTRLGLFRPGAPFEELHDEMLALTPRAGELELHVNLLRHGRRTCHAQRPACGDCALLRMCPYGRELQPPTRRIGGLTRGAGPCVERALQLTGVVSQVSAVAPAASFSVISTRIVPAAREAPAVPVSR